MRERRREKQSSMEQHAVLKVNSRQLSGKNQTPFYTDSVLRWCAIVRHISVSKFFFRIASN